MMQTAAAQTTAKPAGNGAPHVHVESPEQELLRLRAENEKLKAQNNGKLTLKVSLAKPAVITADGTETKPATKGGCVSVYGLGRFPVSLYREQWERLLADRENILAFLNVHSAELSTK